MSSEVPLQGPFVSAERIEVTTPIFYVNAAPHIGHLFSALLADAAARWHRFEGKQVLYMTGTDEHGQKIQRSAAAKGIPTQQFCDEKANISFDDWIRTTQPRHKVAVEEIWRRCVSSGSIYKDKHEGWYCVSDETFVKETDTGFIDKDGQQALRPTILQFKGVTVSQVRVNMESRQPVEWVTEENYKFRLSAFSAPLLQWLNQEPSPVCPDFRKQDCIAFIQSGLQDISLTPIVPSVSRPADRIEWGIPVPDDPSHRVYVWMDALTNYLTVLGFPDEGKAREYWPNVHHILGKDIVRFHAIYWPAFLIAAGLPLPKRLTVHGHWLSGGMKMSKSLGNIVDPHEIIDTFGLDTVRYFLIKEDGDFTVDRLKATYIADLADKYGNLISRCVALTSGKQLPVPPVFDARDSKLLDEYAAAVLAISARFSEAEFGKGLNDWVEIIVKTNGYFTETKPWELRKKDPQRCDAVVFTALHILRGVTMLLLPVMPATASSILDLFCVPTAARLLSRLPVAPAPLQLSEAADKPNFFPKTAAFEAKPAAPVPAKAAAGGDSGKEKKAPPVVTVVTTDDKSRLNAEQLQALEAAVEERAVQAEVVKGLKAKDPQDKAAIAAAIEQLGLLTAKIELARRV